eukprot:11402503-Ditylum_brightwellii.AAC.1
MHCSEGAPQPIVVKKLKLKALVERELKGPEPNKKEQKELVGPNMGPKGDMCTTEWHKRSHVVIKGEQNHKAEAMCTDIMFEADGCDGLSNGYMLSRAIKLAAAATTYIGRIDQPFLGEGAGVIGGMHLDKFPAI